MDLLFDITAGKTVIFLAILTQENGPVLTCRKIIIFSFIPNSVMKAIWPSYFIGRRLMVTGVLSVADSCIIEGDHWQNNPNITPIYRVQQEECAILREGVPYVKLYRKKNQNTYIKSLTVTEIMDREKSGLLWCPRTVSCQLTVQMHARPSVRYYITY
jgi:hypothetical protein